MENWGMFDLYVSLLMTQQRMRRSEPLAPPARTRWSTCRRRLAHELIDLSLRLDADAARAALGSAPARPLRGSDA